MDKFQPLLNYVLCFLGALAVALFSIPNIIFVAKRKRLLDMPDNNRKLHARIVPNLGGVGIFFAYIIITSLFISPSGFEKWNYIAAASLVLFVTGLKDDLVSISPSKKFLAQFIAAFIVAYFADVRITSLHGIMGVYELPLWISIGFTILGCMFVTNAFNLIDGVDGLAASVGMMASLIIGISFAMAGRVSETILAFSLMGAIGGFLRYNLSPAKIFMGDTGSLLIGFVLSVLAILFVKIFSENALVRDFSIIHAGSGALVMALSILFVPIFDTFRVFIKRILMGYSPFRADRTHLHHYLLDLGLSHNGTVSVIVTANLFIIAISWFMQDYNVHIGVASLFLVAFGLFGILFFLRRTKATTTKNLANNKPDATLHLTVNGVSIKVDAPQELVEMQN